MSKKKTPIKEILSQQKKLLRLPQPGDLVEGRIIKISKNAVFLELDPWGTGIIYGGELRENRELFKELELGQKISALVLEPENEDGHIELSFKEALSKQIWDELKEKKQANKSLTVKVREANRGGLVIEAKGITGFLPVSQLAPQHYPRVEGGDKNKILKHLNEFVGKELKVKILDLDPKIDKLIVSEKAVDKKKIQESLKKYKEGDTVEGTVTALADFGAFIKLDDGLEGLVHISELDWQIIDHPNQVLEEKQRIKAKIIDIQDDQISLSLKALQKDPWEGIEKKYQNGQVIQGEVIRFSNQGALVKVDDKIHGFINLAAKNLNETNQPELEIGKSYKFKIVSLNPSAHKMLLALK